MGRLLRVDLTRDRLSADDLDLAIAKKFIGGAGYAAKVIYNEVSSQIHPLSPENLLIFMAGPMVGSKFPGATKWSVCARSPLTNIWGESNASGSWGPELKHSGFDGIIISGKAKRPAYIYVTEGEAEIKSAEHLWGMETIKSARIIQSDLSDSRIRVASIGPAGERLVFFASILTDEERACGRTGMGAVMGSKNLKAVAVRGTNKVPLADEDEVKELSDEARDIAKPPKAPPYTLSRVNSLSTHGTAGTVESLNELGALPTKNWSKAVFHTASKITGEMMSKTILSRRGMCPLCGIMTCWRYVDIGKGPYAPVKGRGPEYETCAALGSLCMNDDLELIAKANELCNALGIDTISTGSTIAFAMECYEKGILTKKETDGIDLTWGSSATILEVIKLIGKKEGIGAILSEGVKRAAQKIGKNAERYAMHVKGLEVPMHDPRRWWTMALAYATSNRGACHLQGTPLYIEMGLLQPEFGYSEKLLPFVVEGKAAATKFYQDFWTAFTAMGHCQFTIGGVIPFDLVAKAFSAITGWKASHWDLLKCGERIWNLKRAFNIRMGVSMKDDALPERLQEPLNEGPIAGKAPPLKTLLKEYYDLRGWREGKPTNEKLEELDLREISPDLWDT